MRCSRSTRPTLAAVDLERFVLTADGWVRQDAPARFVDDPLRDAALKAQQAGEQWRAEDPEVRRYQVVSVPGRSSQRAR